MKPQQALPIIEVGPEKPLQLNEHYVSVQGEGPRVGTPTQFVRFSGCNLRCPGWPCDTPHAIFPSQWKHDPKYSVEDLVRMIKMKFVETGARNICLTGGEPFMQKSLPHLASRLADEHFTIEIFTNGTFLIPALMHAYARIIMDWKLLGSGELLQYSSMRRRDHNLEYFWTGDVVKFTITGLSDLNAAIRTWKAWTKATKDKVTVYAGVVWGKADDDWLVEQILAHKLPWRLNMQTHKYIWPGKDRGI